MAGDAGEVSVEEMVGAEDEAATQVAGPRMRVSDGHALVELPPAILKAVERDLLRREDGEVRHARHFFKDRDVKDPIILRPERSFADDDRRRFVQSPGHVRAREADHHNGGFIGALMDVGDPDIVLKILRKGDGDRRCSLLWGDKAEAVALELSAKTTGDFVRVFLREG